MESILIAGLASAFVLSVLEYWVSQPLIKAVSGFGASVVSLLLLGQWSLGLIPMALGATFLAAFALSLTGRHAEDLRRTVKRL